MWDHNAHYHRLLLRQLPDDLTGRWTSAVAPVGGRTWPPGARGDRGGPGPLDGRLARHRAPPQLRVITGT
jgi:hypothetical protein